MLTIRHLKVFAFAVTAIFLQSCAARPADSVRRLSFPYSLSDGTRLVGWEIGEPNEQGHFSNVTLRYTRPSAPRNVLHLVVQVGEQFHGFILREVTARPETIGVSGGPIAAILVDECMFQSIDASSSFILGDDEGTQYVELRRSST